MGASVSVSLSDDVEYSVVRVVAVTSDDVVCRDVAVVTAALESDRHWVDKSVVVVAADDSSTSDVSLYVVMAYNDARSSVVASVAVAVPDSMQTHMRKAFIRIQQLNHEAPMLCLSEI